MGKTIVWRPRRGHLVAFALSVLLVAAGSSSAVAAITSVNVPALQPRYTCNLASTSYTLLPTQEAAVTAVGPSTVPQAGNPPTGASASNCGIGIYNIGSYNLLAAMYADSDDSDALYAEATSTMNDVELLGGIVKYTKKSGTVECPQFHPINETCIGFVTYTGLKFAGVSRVFAQTINPVTYEVPSYTVAGLLVKSVCGNPLITAAEFTNGTLTLNTVSVDPSDNTLVRFVPLRLQGTLICAGNLASVKVDIQDVVLIKNSGPWPVNQVTKRVFDAPQYVTAN